MKKISFLLISSVVLLSQASLADKTINLNDGSANHAGVGGGILPTILGAGAKIIDGIGGVISRILSSNGVEEKVAGQVKDEVTKELKKEESNANSAAQLEPSLSLDNGASDALLLNTLYTAVGAVGNIVGKVAGALLSKGVEPAKVEEIAKQVTNELTKE